jgi:hypothetical protein
MSLMRKITKYLLYVFTFVLMAVAIPVFSSAETVDDFVLSYSANLTDSILTVDVDITVPPSEGNTTSCVFATFYVNEIQLVKTAQEYSNAPVLTPLGDTCWVSSSNQAWFSFVNIDAATDEYAGGTEHFQIKFDVSDVNVNVGDTLTIGPSKTSRIATWNGSGVTVPEGTVLATCVITGSGSSSGNDSTLTASNFTAPNNSESYFETAGIAVTPSTSDLSFTVACNKACVVAKAKEDGTYTVLPATTEDGVHTYTAESADDQIVVAVKGDANGDGSLDISDVLGIVDAYTANTLTVLQNVVADVSNDNSVDITDVLAIVDAYVGNGLSW